MPNDDENMEIEKMGLELNDDEQEELVVPDDDIAQEDVQEKEEKLFSQEEVDNLVKKRLGKAERKSKRELEQKEKEIEKLRALESSLRAGLGVSDDDDIVEKVNSFYKQQGVDIPKVEVTSNKRDSQRLGEYDAQDLISSADFDEIQDRANELASLKQSGNISDREDAEFMKLGSYLSEELKVRELKEKGFDTSVLDKAEFKDFAKKFNSNVAITDVYDLFVKINGQKPVKPASTGSTKSTVGDTKVKKYYTSEEVDKLTSKDLDNPTIFNNVMASMKKWGK